MFSIPGIENLPSAVQFAIVFAIIFGVFGLIVIVWRRLIGGRVAMQSGDRDRTRTRQPRLGIVDVYDLDRQRQLVLLRRDNVEHLLLIGGPNDVVIETNIVRSGAGRPAMPVDNGDRAEGDRTVEAAAARPVLETSWSNGNGSLAQLGQPLGSVDTTAGAAMAPVQTASAQGSGGEGEPSISLQKTLTQYLRRPEGGAAATAKARPQTATPQPARQATIRPPAAAPPATTAPSPPPPASAGDAKLPFGMRATPRPKPAPSNEPASPSGTEPPDRLRSSPQPSPEREHSPPVQVLTPATPESVGIGDQDPEPVEMNPARAPEPSLVDTSRLSDMAKQLESALRRPLPPAQSVALDQSGAPPQSEQPHPAPSWAKPLPSAPSRPPASAAPEGPPRSAEGLAPGNRPSPPLVAPRFSTGTAIEGAPSPAAAPKTESDFDRPLLGGAATLDEAADSPEPFAEFRQEAPATRSASPSLTRPIETPRPEHPTKDAATSAPADTDHEDRPDEARSAEPAPQRQNPPEPPSERAAARVDPFSMEDIEAEFARLLGRPLDKRQS